MFSFVSTILVHAEENDFVITYSNPASYEIIIPTEIEFNTTTNEAVIDIIVENVNLAEEHVVVVSVNSSNFEEYFWYLVDVSDPSNRIEYLMSTSDRHMGDILNGYEIANFSEDGEKSIYVKIPSVNVTGVFVDTLTFTSEIAGEYHLSGSWVFHEAPTPYNGRLTEAVNFSTGDYESEYNWMEIYKQTDGILPPGYEYDFLIRHGKDGSSGYRLYSYSMGWSDGLGEKARTINFTSTQTVSKEFYDWFQTAANRRPS